MRRLLLLLLVPLCACPPPEPIDCARGLIDVSGNLSGGFAGGVGGSGGSEAPLGLAGAPLNLTVFAPLSACEADVLRADATLVDPDNAPLELTVASPVARTGSQGAVRASFTFTPRQPGLHTLRVAFEPSLGARSVSIDVASDGLLGATTRVPIPTGSTCSVWPLTDDTVACEEQGSGFVSVTSADGGFLRFPGKELVVADTVLWSIDGTTLERRVYEDGGLRLTHQLPSFPPLPTPGMHDVDVALRLRASNLITRIRLTPTGVSLGDFAVESSAGALAYFIEPDDELFRVGPQSCFSTPCTNLDDVLGLEPGVVWRSQSGFDRVATLIVGYERPPTASTTPRFSLARQASVLAAPVHGFECLPLWLSTSSAQHRFLVSAEGGAFSYSAWPLSQVLAVGRRHLVLTSTTGSVRVVKR